MGQLIETWGRLYTIRQQRDEPLLTPEYARYCLTLVMFAQDICADLVASLADTYRVGSWLLDEAHIISIIQVAYDFGRPAALADLRPEVSDLFDVDNTEEPDNTVVRPPSPGEFLGLVEAAKAGEDSFTIQDLQKVPAEARDLEYYREVSRATLHEMRRLAKEKTELNKQLESTAGRCREELAGAATSFRQLQDQLLRDHQQPSAPQPPPAPPPQDPFEGMDLPWRQESRTQRQRAEHNSRARVSFPNQDSRPQSGGPNFRDLIRRGSRNRETPNSSRESSMQREPCTERSGTYDPFSTRVSGSQGGRATYVKKRPDFVKPKSLQGREEMAMPDFSHME
jgi:hypothetical protein